MPVSCRFIAGLAGEIRMRRWRKIRFDASIRTSVAIGVSCRDQTCNRYRRPAFFARDGHFPQQRHDARRLPFSGIAGQAMRRFRFEMIEWLT
jgi:uncharacterized Fe-S cluster-containing radical SAM superfamily protein